MDVLAGALVALASALLGALASARFQRTAEYRAWLRDTRLRCYAEFADAARRATNTQMELFDRMVELNAGDTLDERTAGRLLESIAAVGDELERLHSRILMVGLPLAADADRIVVSTREVIWWAEDAGGIKGGTVPDDLLLPPEDVDEFIEKARADLSR
jgi:hypothetical protein